MVTIGEVISRIRNQVKSVKQDAFMTDRFIYSLLRKHAKWLIRRQDSANKVMKMNSVFQTLDFMELEDIDRVEATCLGITSGCHIKRTKDKVPAMMEGYWGPLIRTVSSIDGSEEVVGTFPMTFEKISKQKTFKYNKKKYYWYLDGYLYFPNLEWDAVRVEGVFEEDISRFNCDSTDDCVYRQFQPYNVPEFLHAEIESQVIKDLGVTLGIPQDAQQDNRHIAR